MTIRKSTERDIPRMMAIYTRARAFMAAHGNPNQWGPTGWPPEALIRRDIQEGNSHVCLNDAGDVVGTFFFLCGADVEPTYRSIEDGAWLDDGTPYGTLHRLGSDGTHSGVLSDAVDWA